MLLNLVSIMKDDLGSYFINIASFEMRIFTLNLRILLPKYSMKHIKNCILFTFQKNQIRCNSNLYVYVESRISSIE